MDAARAGAAVVHIHVRDPATGAGARDPALFSEVVSRIRAVSGEVDPVLNLTAGMGGDLVLGDPESPLPVDPAATDMAGASERLAHVAELMPEICTLDCGTMNFAAGGEYIMANTPGMLRAMARRVQELGVRPELEVFDTGHLVLVHELIQEGLIDDPPLIQLCMGIPYGAPADVGTLLAMVARLPAGAVFSAFAIGRLQLRSPRWRRWSARTSGLDWRTICICLAAAWRPMPSWSSGRWDCSRGSECACWDRTRCARSSRCAPVSDLPQSVGLLGGGVIGGGWAARFLLAGVDVTVYDPDPDAAAKVGRLLENARRAYDKLTVLPLPPEGALTFASSVEEAVAGAALVQESAPERLELKQRLLAAASAAAGPEVVICSSTSGLRPSVLALEMDHPERFVVGHPFNPVYLLPLVELCAGDATAPSAVERAAAVYRALGMHPLTLRHEIDGFIADRLLEALWREALWLVHDDVASVAEVDDAIRYGAGLRWAIMGTFLTYRLAGGEEGMRAFLEHFGPALALPWTKLVDVPELTPSFLDKIADQSDAQAQGRSVPELERERDDALVGVLQALRARGVGAGATVAAWERGLLDVGPSARHELVRRRAARRRSRCTRARSRRTGSTTTATSPKAATSTCSGRPPTPCSATSGSTRPTSIRAGATTRSRPTSPTSGSCTPATASRRPPRSSASTTSASTCST